VFIGHFAVAFAAKRAAPAVSLGTLFVAAQLADLAWPVLVLAGIERFEIRPGATAFTPLAFIHYPWSHSLVMLALWGALLGAGWMAMRRGGMREALVIAAVVASHWVLDALTHRPDMPLAPGGGVKVGVGLWESIPATVAIEGMLFAICVGGYMHATQARDAIGHWALWALVAFLSLVYVASFMGPPPPSVEAVAWTALSMWLLVAWGYWIDAHRSSGSGSMAPPAA
jgi:membrane-bound metal-dependent hydrolase YbcI (DUF457 family)